MRNTFQITFLTLCLLQHSAQENGGEGQMPDKVLNTMLKHGGTQKPFSYVPTGMDLKKFKEKARQYVFIFQSAWWLFCYITRIVFNTHRRGICTGA